MSEAAVYETTVCVPLSHPALPGHFPGRPIVPGVIVLDAVLAAAEQWLGRALSVSGLPQAKFSAPLLPQRPAHLQLQLTGTQLRFSVTADSQALAQGIFELAAARP